MNLSFDENVYPDHLMHDEKPPLIVFAPSKEIMQVMVAATANCNDKHELLRKFGDEESLTQRSITRQHAIKKIDW